MLRPVVMEYPKDPMAKMQNLSYMLGDSLLVSPAFDREEYDLYLPEGQWRNIESKEVYEGGSFVHVETKSFADGGLFFTGIIEVKSYPFSKIIDTFPDD